MNAIVWEHPSVLLGGLLIGFVLGFLLQKGRLARFDTIIGQFLFKDFTMMRFLLSALVTGGVTLYAMHELGVVTTIPAAQSSLFGSISGGIFLGIGMALLGYCPGSTLVAIGQGAQDALFGALGLVVGAVFFEALKPSISAFLKAKPYLPTLPELTGLNPWIFLGALTLGTLIFVRFLRRKNL
jgi:uncharacterized membrane protein YedE/YeeE